MTPASIDDLKAGIVRGQFTVPSKMTCLARWLFENPAEVAFGSARSVATKSGASPSCVQRLAAAFGYDGFRAMKIAFQVHLRQQASRRLADVAAPRATGAAAFVSVGRQPPTR